jgi:D-alanyl-D-alanine carboxypeptidase/D-alanyl-D-alanine-endopeptidase (penicillin-binding protein 4)
MRPQPHRLRWIRPLAAGALLGLLPAAPLLSQPALPEAAAAAGLPAASRLDTRADTGFPDADPPVAADLPEPAPEPQGQLPTGVAALLPELTLQPDQISAYVRRIGSRHPLLAVNADVPRIPASTIKLLTSIAALDLLGPNYQWRTEVLITGDVVAGTLEGDLHIKGYGDPFITTEAYAGLIRAVREKGIRHVAGDVIFDNSHLMPPTAARGDFDGAAHRSYNALPAALSLNRQVTYVNLYNDRERGGVGVYTDPPLSHVQMVNTAQVVQAPCKSRFHRLSVIISEPEPVPAAPGPDQPPAAPSLDALQGTGAVGAGDIVAAEPLPADDLDPGDLPDLTSPAPISPVATRPVPHAQGIARLTINGSFASECPDERIPRLILSPEQHAAAAFDAIWRDSGGTIHGRVLAARTPDDAEVFHVVYSQPLHEVLRTVNKWSDNLMARMVFLALGIEHAGPPGSLEKSRDAFHVWLAERGFSFPALIVDNGSGLSRDARIGADSMGELLAWSYHQPWMPELMASMAIMGVDGTLTERMQKEPIEGRAHMKTGTVRDASCIAGYVLDPQGRRWVVVALVNALPGRRLAAWHGHAVHHALLRWVFEGAELR